MVVRIREIFVFLKLERVSFDELLLGQFTTEFVIGRNETVFLIYNKRGESNLSAWWWPSDETNIQRST